MMICKYYKEGKCDGIVPKVYGQGRCFHAKRHTKTYLCNKENKCCECIEYSPMIKEFYNDTVS